MIETRGLSYRYGAVAAAPALHFPELSLAQGASLILQGNSGSGKSTWLALVAGLRRASAGEITVAGQALNRLSGPQRDAWRARQVGFLPQKLHLSDALSVAGNLALAYFAAGLPVDEDAIHQTLSHLAVADLADRKPQQLSGGQAQRVALARAVLMQPQVLLADEPTASLDDASAAAALLLLTRTAARCGATLVIATHDARVVQGLPDCRRLVLMANQAVSA
jgi:putative ABC transport system ATP-binding protein